MKALLILTLLASTASKVEAPIEKVTVFSDRAEVTRSARFSCNERDSVLLALPLLPESLDARTLRAKAHSRAEVVGLASRLESVEQPLDPEVASIREELQRIEDARSVLDHRKRTAEERGSAASAYATYLTAVLREASRGEQADAELWSAAMDTIHTEREKLAKELLEIAAERKTLDRRADLLGRRLSAKQAARKLLERERGHLVEVTLVCRETGRGDLSLSYVVRGATWAPEYDLRFVSEGSDGVGEGRARIEVGAIVRQATGEDWGEATIVLSTARPRLGAKAPQPATLYIDGEEVGKERVLVQDVEDRRALPVGTGETDRPAPSQAQLDDGGRAFTLTLPGKVDIRADNRPYRFPVDAIETAASGRRVSAPKLAPHVYRVVQLENPASFPLLKGRMHVFRDGAYAGRVALEHTAPGAPMEISMGADETVRIRRDELTEIDRSPGFLRRTRRMERAYRIEIVNAATGPATVEVRESIPVSRVDDIEVRLDQSRTTSGFDFDEERGILSWTVELEEGEKAHVDLAFTVRLPDDWELASR